MNIEWPSCSDPYDRHRRTERLLQSLLPKAGARILEIKHTDLSGYCKQAAHTYQSVQPEDRAEIQGAYDLVYLGFVLHAVAEDTLPLLNLIRKHASQGYVIIGEDLACASHSEEWHERNHAKCKKGVFRSDREWKCLFDFFRMRLQARYIIRRSDDVDEQVYRCLYVLKCA